MAQAPAVLFVPIWLLRRGKHVQAKVAAVIPPLLSWSHYLAMPNTGGLGLLGLGTTVWFLAVSGLTMTTDANTSVLSLESPRFLTNSPRKPCIRRNKTRTGVRNLCLV
jgi:hypothetical protein